MSRMKQCIIDTAIKEAKEVAMITIDDVHIQQGVLNIGVVCGQKLVDLVQSWPTFRFDAGILKPAQMKSEIHTLILSLLQGALEMPDDHNGAVADVDMLTASQIHQANMEAMAEGSVSMCEQLAPLCFMHHALICAEP